MPTHEIPSVPVARRGLRGLVLVVLLLAGPAVARAQLIGELEALFVTPAAPTSEDTIVIHALTICSNPFIGAPSVDGHVIALNTFPGGLFPPCSAPLPGAPPLETRFTLPKLPAGSYSIYVVSDGPFDPVVVYSSVFQVAPATSPSLPVLTLAGEKFQIRVLHGAVVQNGTVVGGQPAPAVQLSDESGYFWFFQSANTEVTVKLLDGRVLNGHYWLFAASMTNEPFVIELTDLRGGCTGASCTKIYANPAGTNKNVIDLTAASD